MSVYLSNLPVFNKLIIVLSIFEKTVPEDCGGIMKKDKNKIQLTCVFIQNYAVDISKNRLCLYLRGV
jgi:hypothetical protein